MIDPTARVDASADLERDVSVGAGNEHPRARQVRQGALSVARGSSARTSSSTRASTLGDRVQVHRGAILYQGVTADDGVFIGPAAILTNYRRPRALNLAGQPLGPGDWEISPIHLSSGSSVGAAAIDRRPVRYRACSHDRCGRGRHPRRARVMPSSPAILPAVSAGHASAADDSPTPTGHPAPAEREKYAIDQALVCPVCDRRYALRSRRGDASARYRPAGGRGAPA